MRESGCEDYRESIKIMFAKAYNIPPNHVLKYQNYEDLDENATLLLNMVNRRAAGEPISHIIGLGIFGRVNFTLKKQY